MAQIICIIGNKGGTGKTSLSHMLCQGLGLLGRRAACVLTDTYREPLNPRSRRYITADARTNDALVKVVDKLRTLEDWVGVIDGGGNRMEMDRQLYAMSDIVLLPFRESAEDIRTVARDLDAFPRAYAVPSQWPTNAWQRQAADRNVRDGLRAYHHRLLNPINALSASKLLLQKDIPEQLPTPLSNMCRAFARQVLEIMELASDEHAPSGEPAARQTARANSKTPHLPAEERPLRLRGGAGTRV